MTRSERSDPAGLPPRLRAWHDAGAYCRHRGHAVFHRCGGSGPPLLLLHAYPTAGWGWHRVWDGLARGHRLIAPDLLGSGFSDKPRRGPYAIADLADQVESVLARLGVESVDVLAHAYGVSPAQELLARDNEGGARRPFRLRSVAFLNGALFPEAVGKTRMQRLLTGPFGPLLAGFAPQPWSAFRRNMKRAFGPDTQPGEKELVELWELLRFNGGHRVTPWVLGYLDDRRRHGERLVGALADAAVPLQLIHTPGDPILGERAPALWRRHVPRGRLDELTARVGHYPPLETPAAVLECFLAFQADC